jgi:hypothetical protein
MAKRSKLWLQKRMIELMSDGEVWSSRQLFEEVKDSFKGPDSYNSLAGVLGQMARFTNPKLKGSTLAPTHRIVKVAAGRVWSGDKQKGIDMKFVLYQLVERD